MKINKYIIFCLSYGGPVVYLLQVHHTYFAQMVILQNGARTV
jgi:hypothetical protein